MDVATIPAARARRSIRSLPRSACTALCVVVLIVPAGALARTSSVDPCRLAASREAYAPRAFGGYACRDDRCSAHKAGFRWAERNGMTDARACTKSDVPAFNEGCRAFVEEAVTAEQAGFAWARENEIDATCDCAGAGPGFDAGCTAYVTGFAQ